MWPNIYHFARSLRRAGAYPSPDETELIPLVSASGKYVVGTRTTSGLFARSRQLIVPVGGNSKVGATAGWVITAGDNIGHATLPASQTSSTLVVPIEGLAVGDTVTAVSVVGQVESAGGNVTLTMDVRKLSAASAADLTDASLGTDNVGTLTADTLLTDANGNLKVTALTEVMDATERLYCLLTGTTAASTDIDISALVITVTRS